MKRARAATVAEVVTKTLSAPDAATYVGYSIEYLRAARIRRVRCEGPPFIRIGRSIRYLIADLDRWLESHRVVSPAPEGR